MTFKEFFEQIKELYDNHPEYHNLKAVYAKDDEGNGYSNVIYKPSIGEYDGEGFYGSDDCDDNDLKFNPEIRSVIKGKEGGFKLVKYFDVPVFQWLEYNHSY